MLVTEKVLGPVDDPVAQQVVLRDLSVVPLVPWGVLIVLYVCLGVLELLFVVCVMKLVSGVLLVVLVAQYMVVVDL